MTGMVSSPMTALLAQMATKGAAWVVRPVGEVTEPDPADVDAARRAVEAVGAELWATTDEADFRDCLSDMLDRDPPPPIWPLLAHLTRTVEPSDPRRRMSRLLDRAVEVFGPARFLLFRDAVLETERVVERAAHWVQPKTPLPESFFDPAFPPSLRKATLSAQRATLCAFAAVDALIRGERVPKDKATWILATWLGEQRAFLWVLGGAGRTSEEVAESLQREGIEVDAHLGTLLGAHPA